MKLGEALALRADLQKRMNQARQLLLENATVQEGDAPVVSAAALLEEYRQLTREHEQLVRRINRTNIGARVAVADETLS
ncbi:MAG: DIP1984 family protein, partial [Gemmatimonadetes bacterium]|nr:DIP1984 family protein [Gemmatimonadota bacterium]